mmetsp:Transcript_57718/g.159631  ORF Transcript_57718/g.159631 Transcript_57718/m.159631 type:complete len:98 (+) Transcript_57718:98-391(+)
MGGCFGRSFYPGERVVLSDSVAGDRKGQTGTICGQNVTRIVGMTVPCTHTYYVRFDDGACLSVGAGQVNSSGEAADEGVRAKAKKMDDFMDKLHKHE